MLDGFEFTTMTKKKTKGGGSSSSKPRFSDEQIRSLEVMFRSETKLDPGKKLQLARELGLHPRQIAIWFQNKRARCKSKRVEKEYTILLANYNNLASQFESLRKEKQSLAIQLQKLKSEMMVVVGKCDEEEHPRSSQIQETAGSNSISSEGESEVKQIGSDQCLKGMLSDDDIDSSIKEEFLRVQLNEEEEELLKGDSSLISAAEDWTSSSLVDSEDLMMMMMMMNQPKGDDQCYQWWDFWS